MWTSSSSSAAAAAAMSLSSSTSTSTSSAPPKLKTMEEVWKDINFAATDLRHHPSFRGVILQDFFSKDPPPTSAASPASTPLPPTILTLSSGLDHFGPLLFHPISNVSSPADAVVPDGGSGCVKKRFPDPEWSSGDLRHKRMIKNRESAARSRARKQAYTNELELELAHLLEENAKLRKKQEQFCREAAAEHQKMKPLHRTSTAPF